MLLSSATYWISLNLLYVNSVFESVHANTVTNCLYSEVTVLLFLKCSFSVFFQLDVRYFFFSRDIVFSLSVSHSALTQLLKLIFRYLK